MCSTSSASARKSACGPRPAHSCTIRCARWWARWRWWARANGAWTMFPPRLPPAIAPPVHRLLRPTDSICCAWITSENWDDARQPTFARPRASGNPDYKFGASDWIPACAGMSGRVAICSIGDALSEISIQNLAIHRGQRGEIRDAGAFVDLMHGRSDQAEFEHGAIMLDEARIGRAAARGKLRRDPGHLFDRADHQVEKRRRPGDEGIRIRGFPNDVPAHAGAGGFRRTLLDQGAQRYLAVAVVEPDVEPRPRLAGNEIDHRIADIDRGEFEIGGVEIGAALVKRRPHQRAHQADQAPHGIVGAFGIGDMALFAGDYQRAVERTAPPDFDRIADRGRVAWLAQDAMIETFAALGGP